MNKTSENNILNSNKNWILHSFTIGKAHQEEKENGSKLRSTYTIQNQLTSHPKMFVYLRSQRNFQTMNFRINWSMAQIWNCPIYLRIVNIENKVDLISEVSHTVNELESRRKGIFTKCLCHQIRPSLVLALKILTMIIIKAYRQHRFLWSSFVIRLSRPWHLVNPQNCTRFRTELMKVTFRWSAETGVSVCLSL